MFKWVQFFLLFNEKYALVLNLMIATYFKKVGSGSKRAVCGDLKAKCHLKQNFTFNFILILIIFFFYLKSQMFIENSKSGL